MTINKLPDSVQLLIDNFTRLPGIGKKNALRLALHLVTRDKVTMQHLSGALNHASTVQLCTYCQTLSDTSICPSCSQTQSPMLCVVERAIDTFALTESGLGDCHFFVLHGSLSPLDGMGPDQLGFALLAAQLNRFNIQECVLATSGTVEGEATSTAIVHYLKEHHQFNGSFTRLAYGMPVGGELEFVDRQTLALALDKRQKFGD